jgi:hypothetical protein
MILRTMVVLGLALALCPALPTTATAQGIDTTNPELPPEGVYLTAEDVHAMYDGVELDVVLEAAVHKPIADRAQREAVGPDELEIFPSEFTAIVTVDQGAGPSAPTPILLTGPVETMVFNKIDNTTGTFDTEMISMTLTGDVGGLPVQIREDPDRPSLGQTDIVDLGGGLYHIDSFFDVFTELWVDTSFGGGNWVFAAETLEPTRVTLFAEAPSDAIPEPATLALVGLGVLGLIARRRS